MIVSDRRHLANFFNRAITRDDRGQPVENWTLTASTMCDMNHEISDESGHERDITQHSARIILRPVFGVNTTSRVIINGVIYNIKRITELKRTLWQFEITEITE